MNSFRSIATMTLVAACIAAPFLAQTLFAASLNGLGLAP
jgi:hypothetical protein